MYDVVHADFAHEYNNRHLERQDGKKTRFGVGAAGRYQVMSHKDGCDLPVEYIVNDDAFLFHWSTWTHMKQSIEMMEAWGFRYVTAAFIWIKLNPKAMTPFFGVGHYTKSNTEPCLLGVRGSPLQKLEVSNRISQIVRTDEPIPIIHPRIAKPHSAKPPIVRHLIDEFCIGRKIELFARDCYPGWDALGNEIDGKDIRHTLPCLVIDRTMRQIVAESEKIKMRKYERAFANSL